MRTRPSFVFLPLSLLVLSGCGDSGGEGGEGGEASTTRSATTTSSTSSASGTTTSATSTISTSSSVSASSSSTGVEACQELVVDFTRREFLGYAAYVYGTVSPALGGAEPDEILVSLFLDSNGAHATGTIDLSQPPNDNYATCLSCVRVFEDQPDGATYYQSSGDILVDPDSDLGSVGFSLADVTLREATIDPFTYESTFVPGGRCVHINSGDAAFFATPEECTGGLDEDADGYPDCADTDCAGTPACVAAIAAACGGAVILQPGTSMNDDTTGGTNVFGEDGCETIGGAGAERIYSFTPPTSGTAIIRVSYLSADLSVTVRSNCNGPSSVVACADFWPAGGDDEIATFPVVGGVPLSVVVDSRSSVLEGELVIEASVIPPVAGDVCATAEPLVGTNASSFYSAVDDVAVDTGTCAFAYPTAGPERFFSFTLDPGQTLTTTVTPSGFGDPMLYVVSDCASVGNSCLATQNSGDYGAPETITFQSASGGTYYLVVDSSNSASSSFGFNLATTIQ